MNALLRLIERISGLSGSLTAWLVVPLIAATAYDVAARYLFALPTQWAYEVGYMMMGTHALLGMAYTLREGGHIRIDALSQRFSERTKAIIDLIGYAIFVLPCLSGSRGRCGATGSTPSKATSCPASQRGTR